MIGNRIVDAGLHSAYETFPDKKLGRFLDYAIHESNRNNEEELLSRQAMSSRAAFAASSRRVKQELVHILFGSEASASSSSSTMACHSRKMDPSIYSYSELRSVYLERLQSLHPDKHYSIHSRSDPPTRSQAPFVELQQAWDRYDQMVKLATKVDTEGHPDKDRNFTLFGVGCSFADNERERQWRTKITDQACRGWFSSGSLEAQSTRFLHHKSSEASSTGNGHISLLDDDMFVAVEGLTHTSNNDNPQDPRPPRPSLVDPKFHPKSAAR